MIFVESKDYILAAYDEQTLGGAIDLNAGEVPFPGRFHDLFIPANLEFEFNGGAPGKP